MYEWSWGKGWLPHPYAGSMSDLARWLEKVKTRRFLREKLICGQEAPRKCSREDRNHNGADSRAPGPPSMGKVGKAQVAMREASRTKNAFETGQCH